MRNKPDWYHKEYFDIVEEMLAPHGNPKVYSDNNLINGKMHFDCSTLSPNDTHRCTNNAGLAQFRFQTGKTHRLRLINSGGDGVQRFSIDEHTLTVIAEDFVPIKPYNTTVVTLGVGQRTDVLVTADASTSPEATFWMRSNLTSCSPAHQPYAVAVVYYDKANTSTTPDSRAWDVPDPGNCANDPLGTTEPLFPIAVLPPTMVHEMGIELFRNESDVALWRFNGVSMRTDYNSPVILLANDGVFRYPEEWNVVNCRNHTAIRIVVNNRGGGAYVSFSSFSLLFSVSPLFFLTAPIPIYRSNDATNLEIIQPPYAPPRPQLLHPPRRPRRMGRHHRSPVQPVPSRR